MDGIARFPKAAAPGSRLGGPPALSATGYPWVDGDILYAADLNAAFAMVGANVSQDIGRNLLHNPLFNVAQRGTGTFTSGYTLDRWAVASSLDVVSVTRIAVTDAIRAQIGDEAASVMMSGSVAGNAGAGSYTFMYQPIEDVRRLGGKTVTISFWAGANAGTAKLGVSLSQSFGTGGSPSAAVALNGQSVTVGTTFTRYSLTFALPSIAGMTMGTNGDSYTALDIWFSAGATQNVRAGNIGVQTWNWNIWGVQLEVGSVATPLEKPDPRYDLSNCQRFYQTGTFYISGSQGAASGYAGYQVYPVTMRASSSVTPSWTNTNITSPSVPGPSASGFAFLGTTTAAGQTVLSATYTASADL